MLAGSFSRKEAILIELTEEQRHALRNGEAIRIAAPEIGDDVVVLRATQFQIMQESLDDQVEQDAVLRYSMKQAAKVAKENPY
jgi:hypothetical protein